ncbi:UDP-glycosyltransferase 75C1-like [Primulina huaijiensis]|uniref:UDP-glycosyltransferase 75C1-like n=1 Tax=Primulina huaijiensis TaxID=1492673 RepID=UPI003CC6EF74
MEMHQQGANATNRRHFLIICFPVQGHINPALQLAKTLAHGGAKVTFTTTGRGLQRVHETLPSLNGLSYVSFYDGLDPESADGFSSFMADLMKAGSENLLKILEKFVEMGQKVDCLVYSFILPWAARVARAVKVPSAFLSIQCATAFSIYHRFFNGHDGIYSVNGGIKDVLETSVSVEIAQLPLFSATDLPTFLLPDDPSNTFMIPLMQEHIQELEIDAEPCVFVNTFEELEEDAIRTFKDKMNLIAVGPLIPSAFTRGDVNGSTEKSYGADLFHKNDDYFQWLDDKDEHSVIYISFGSIVVLKKEQKEEILQGLREIKRPFLWVIRTTDREQEYIQKSLEHEVKNGDGLIVPWCSQMEVLAHKSIGCFVTHCGWNSTLESLFSGVPMICCPHFSDQTTNAKMVEEVWGTGVRARVNGDVVIGRDEFKRCLEMVMGDGERGREIRYHCKKWRGMAMEVVKEGGSTNKNLKCVVDGHYKV